ncbi:MAG: hypothetical protein JNK06_05735 [Candidatus Accumulibacter phosphatis]|uniref:O-antigen ligase family protein n=1 Tax=Candidatus Accumulibacter phosphatis TaxID=327160 RepID=UPI001A4B6B36|nr:hypothetical protein [Candidatus Accumulibacter phosphatis]
MPIRVINLVVSLAALMLGVLLAAHHPIRQPLPLVLFAAAAIATYRWPSAWLIALPILMPVIGFAPWSGWLTFEEMDLMVLAIAAGGYARSALSSTTQGQSRRTSALLIVLASTSLLSIAISMDRGFIDAGGFHFGWYQGYDGSMNSVRIGKSFILSLLLVPLLNRLLASPDRQANMKLGIGLAGGLATASLAALWERLAFTDILNFSSDYRTTALFWEMHVGGAALDGWLLLTAPFGIWAIRHARTHLQWVGAATILVVGAYASLTTFSRGVYMALPIALAFLGWQLYRQRRPLGEDSGTAWRFGEWAAFVVFLAVLSVIVFPSSGYRGLLALLGLIALSFSIPAILRSQGGRKNLIGVFAGMLLGLLLIILGGYLPKGPYVLYALTLAACVVATMANRNRPSGPTGIATLGGFSALCLAAVSVAAHWGGERALVMFLWALAILLVVVLLAVRVKTSRWPTSLRAQGTVLGVAIGVCAVTSIFSGGAYMGHRFSTTNHDFEGRMRHWQQGLGMLKTPWDFVFGKGLGRFPANYFFDVPTGGFPGAYALVQEPAGPLLKLAGAGSLRDHLRVSQRLPLDVTGPFSVTVKARSDAKNSLYLQVCEKHLLYSGGCQSGVLYFKQATAGWQTFDVPLAGHLFDKSPWYAPRLKVFSIAVDGKVADVAQISLIGPEGKNLLANGDLRDETAHWFFTSDRDHLPWHAKNLFLNVLFDQGLVGLMLFVVVTVAALWRLTIGKARDEPLAPFLSAGIVGFLAVGMFDSLLDVPRLAFLYYFLTLAALTFGERVESIGGRHRSRREKLVDPGLPEPRLPDRRGVS